MLGCVLVSVCAPCKGLPATSFYPYSIVNGQEVHGLAIVVHGSAHWFHFGHVYIHEPITCSEEYNTLISQL